MEHGNIINFVSTILFVIACLVFGVNIITEVIKNLFPKVPATLVAAGLSVTLTMVAFFAWVSYMELKILWYYVVAAMVLGLFVAYAAMFGFDKFKEALEKLKAHRK